jgi:hypothetical protein
MSINPYHPIQNSLLLTRTTLHVAIFSFSVNQYIQHGGCINLRGEYNIAIIQYLAFKRSIVLRCVQLLLNPRNWTKKYFRKCTTLLFLFLYMHGELEKNDESSRATSVHGRHSFWRHLKQTSAIPQLWKDSFPLPLETGLHDTTHDSHLLLIYLLCKFSRFHGDVIMAMAFWVVTLCNFIGGYRRFKRTCSLLPSSMAGHKCKIMGAKKRVWNLVRSNGEK